MLEYPIRRSPIQDTMQIAAATPPVSTVASLLPGGTNGASVSPDSPGAAGGVNASGNGAANAANAMAAAAAAAAAAGGLPQALHNLQRLLQSQLANVNPLQLQQALQRQQQQQMADAGRKQLEQMLQQMQEQLQLNLLQQTHLSTAGGSSKANAATLQNLQQQQQQLVAQMQMAQQALMLGSGNGAGDASSLVSSKEPAASPTTSSGRGRHASETFGSTGSEGSLKENSKPDNNNHSDMLMSAFKTEHLLNGGSGNGFNRHSAAGNAAAAASSSAATVAASPCNSSSRVTTDVKTKLWSHGHCQWPGCDSSFSDALTFQRHLSSAHSLDDKATAQTRVQMQIVTQLELQLGKEKEKLAAMMDHLQLEAKNGELVPQMQSRRHRSRSPSPKRMKAEKPESPEPLRTPRSSAASTAAFHNALATLGGLTNPVSSSGQAGTLQSPLSALTAAVRSPLLGMAAGTPSSVGTLRPKPASELTNKPSPTLPLPPGFDERRGRGDRGNPNLDPEMDIKLNREFYMHNDVRPPYTYAALIRYAIHESPDQQLTLHEIYNWFTTTFQYFRRNAASWKNAVRHNLSLHKCFMRVENVKGAVWTVDDEEYHRRRPPRGIQSSGGPGTGSTNSPTLTPQAPSLLDQSLSSMIAAAAANSGAGHDRLPFFNHAALMEQARRSSSGSAFPEVKSSSGLESPPASLDNRSTPGSLDLSRIRSDLKADDEDDDELAEGPPTMVPASSRMALGLPTSSGSSPKPSKMDELDQDDDESEKKTSLMSSSSPERPGDAQDLSSSVTAKCEEQSSSDLDKSVVATDEEKIMSASAEEQEKAASAEIVA